MGAPIAINFKSNAMRFRTKVKRQRVPPFPWLSICLGCKCVMRGVARAALGSRDMLENTGFAPVFAVSTAPSQSQASSKTVTVLAGDSESRASSWAESSVGFKCVCGALQEESLKGSNNSRIPSRQAFARRVPAQSGLARQGRGVICPAMGLGGSAPGRWWKGSLLRLLCLSPPFIVTVVSDSGIRVRVYR